MRIARRALVVGSIMLSSHPAAAVELPAGFAHEVVVPGLDQPTGMAFLPDGRILVIEQRSAYVRLISDGRIASTDPVLVVPDVRADEFERGLLGIAVDPRWPVRPFLYLYHTRVNVNGPPWGMCRVVRYTAGGDLDDPASENLSFADPVFLIDDIPDDADNHQAGCLRFGPDGGLYVSLGDDADYCAAADPQSSRGQILRLEVGVGARRAAMGAEGHPHRAWPDPPPGAVSPVERQVWAYGLRNPWRFDIDPVTGFLYVADVGADDFEEVTEVKGGEFLGWPWREGMMVMGRGPCPEPGGEGQAASTPPIATFDHGPDAAAVFAGGVYRPVVGAPANWPAEYDGDVFYGDYYKGFYRRLKRVEDAWEPALPVTGQPNATDWGTGFATAVDFHVGPDGSMWWLRQFDDDYNPSSGSVQRIRYVGTQMNVPARERPSAVVLPRPNPFSSHVELGFRIAAPGPARVAVYDVSGRLLAVLWDGVAPAGEMRVAWDGRDREGRPVPPGVVLARITTGATTRAVRLLRLDAR